MEAISQDLRDRVVAACDAGDQSRKQIAERFQVSNSWIGKLLRRRRETGGDTSAKPHAGGRKAVLLSGDPRAALLDLVDSQPDATLAELRDRLAKRDDGAEVSRSTVSRAVAALDRPLKKSRSTRRNATRRG